MTVERWAPAVSYSEKNQREKCERNGLFVRKYSRTIYPTICPYLEGKQLDAYLFPHGISALLNVNSLLQDLNLVALSICYDYNNYTNSTCK